jgi:hypothetical protein
MESKKSFVLKYLFILLPWAIFILLGIQYFDPFRATIPWFISLLFLILGFVFFAFAVLFFFLISSYIQYLIGFKFFYASTFHLKKRISDNYSSAKDIMPYEYVLAIFNSELYESNHSDSFLSLLFNILLFWVQTSLGILWPLIMYLVFNNLLKIPLGWNEFYLFIFFCLITYLPFYFLRKMYWEIISKGAGIYKYLNLNGESEYCIFFNTGNFILITNTPGERDVDHPHRFLEKYTNSKPFDVIKNSNFHDPVELNLISGRDLNTISNLVQEISGFQKKKFVFYGYIGILGITFKKNKKMYLVEVRGNALNNSYEIHFMQFGKNGERLFFDKNCNLLFSLNRLGGYSIE